MRVTSCTALAFAAVALIGPATAANTATAPDFSGVWGRTSVDYEPPPSGPGPVMNKTHTFYMRIGDDANPILKPAAAEAVRKAAAVSRNGANFPTPSNQCTPWSAPFAWRALLMQMVQSKDEVVIFYVGDQQISGRGDSHIARRIEIARHRQDHAALSDPQNAPVPAVGDVDTSRAVQADTGRRA